MNIKYKSRKIMFKLKRRILRQRRKNKTLIKIAIIKNNKKKNRKWPKCQDKIRSKNNFRIKFLFFPKVYMEFIKIRNINMKQLFIKRIRQNKEHINQLIQYFIHLRDRYSINKIIVWKMIYILTNKEQIQYNF